MHQDPVCGMSVDPDRRQEKVCIEVLPITLVVRDATASSIRIRNSIPMISMGEALALNRKQHFRARGT
jgi:hypothetical protein